MRQLPSAPPSSSARCSSSSGYRHLLQPGAASSTIACYGERERSLPRVYARPIEIRKGQTFTQQDLIARLNDIGYAQRPDVAQPGEFAVERQRDRDHAAHRRLQGQARARRCSRRRRGKTASGGGRTRGIQSIEVEGAGRADASSSIGRC